MIIGFNSGSFSDHFNQKHHKVNVTQRSLHSRVNDIKVQGYKLEILTAQRKKNMSVARYTSPNFRGNLTTIEKVRSYIMAHYMYNKWEQIKWLRRKHREFSAGGEVNLGKIRAIKNCEKDGKTNEQ